MPTHTIRTFAAFMLLMLVWTGCATDDHFSRFQRVDEKVGGFTKHYRESLFSATANRHFSVELILPGSISKGENRFYLIIHDRDGKDVPGADILISLRAEGGVDGGTKGTVTDAGGGLYRGNVSLPDSLGKGKLFVKITKDGITDSAVIIIH
jgi:hypothetical protein